MNFLEERIIRDGIIKPGDILKVDSFLNHQIDVALLDEIACEFLRRFAGNTITKVLTIEASGIAIACAVGRQLGVPVVFAKKSQSRNLDGDTYVAQVKSFTHGNTNTVMVSKEYLGPEDRVLIVDDFLATGAALRGLKELVEMAGGSVAGAGIAIEKVFQGGGDLLRKEGMRVESLARIASMTDDSITFC